MSSASLCKLILLAGVVQAAGTSMNGQLHESIPNPWMLGAVSFGLVFLLAVSGVLPRPLPTATGQRAMPWWAPFGGIAASLAIDYFGLLRMDATSSADGAHSAPS